MATIADTADIQAHPLTTTDGIPLKVSLARAERKAKTRAFLLVVPLLVFIIVTFIIPLGQMTYRSVDNAVVPEVLSNTAPLLADWDGGGLPPEAIYEAMARDLKSGREDRSIGKVAARLNYEDAGFRSLLNKTSRRIGKVESGPWKAAMIDIDDDWEDPAIWALLKRESGSLTDSYYLSAVDLTRDETGAIVSQPEYQQIYVKLFWRTFWMSGLITVLCLLLGFPISYMMANLPLRYSNLLMILVLLPFWTSLLVRTTSWIVMLQSEGVLNDILVWSGVISDDGRLQMIYNKTGTIVAMTHILLPFMVLPLYSVMKTIPPTYMRAARSLGANPVTAFRRVYVPQTLAGVGAGAVLVFILAIGYYITPALVGGQSGQLIGNFIAYHMQQSLNWGLAAALGTILLAAVLILYLVYNKLVGVDKMKFG